MTKNLSFTLNFSEEDESIWAFLHTFPPDQWENILKKALHAYSAEGANPGQWSLEDLCVIPPAEDSMMKSHPLEHLFQLIGEEEDEEVLELLSRTKLPSVERLAERAPSVPMPEVDQEPVAAKEDVQKSVKGLAFLLNQVIGEEEDPEVLSFFLRSENRKKV
ncbi:MAG TPA: hypothetical protein GX523_01400 [Desulfitobacterium dehalogenans]|uniref:Uncharacterized protein n=1 Tax=Desulfitobacterium dehalogenans TaxID=36854 RepID=A0A7C6Z2E6_9FIRM|nr:hypothetical protein [Desulfitobacterium dehalogenans]